MQCTLRHVKNSKIRVEIYFEWESMYIYLEDWNTFVGSRNHPKTVQICTPDQYDQIFGGFIQLGTFKQLEFSLLLKFFKCSTLISHH